MWRKEINLLRKIVNQVGFIYKIHFESFVNLLHVLRVAADFMREFVSELKGTEKLCVFSGAYIKRWV